MTSRTSTGETPFSLAYGVEAMIPMEVGIPSLWHETYNPEENHALMCYKLDLLMLSIYILILNYDFVSFLIF